MRALITGITGQDGSYLVEFLLAALTNAGQVPPYPGAMHRHAQRLGEPDLFYPQRRMQALARRERMDAVFLAADRKVYLHGFPNAQKGGGHWNEKGHALAAELIAQHLCSGRH